MKAAFITEPRKLSLQELEPRGVGPKDIKVEIRSSGICGTDVHIYGGDYIGTYPIIPGHEFSGVVVETGAEVERIHTGDRVAIEPNIACDNCEACLNNHQNFCENWQGIGVTMPGGMAEYAVVPEKAVFNIGDLSFEAGAFVEPLSCVLHGVERTGFSLADRVLIVGAGPIGVLLAKTIALEGASEITQVDRNAERLALAGEHGAHRTAASLEELGEEQFDVVVDATGVPAVMAQVVDYARYGGTALLFGVPPQDGILSVNAFPIFRKGLRILSSFTSVRNSIQAVRLLGSGRITVDALISHRLPLSDLETGIDLMETGRDGVMKVHIMPQE